MSEHVFSFNILQGAINSVSLIGLFFYFRLKLLQACYLTVGGQMSILYSVCDHLSVMVVMGQLKYSERNLALCFVRAINPTWTGLGFKLGLHGEKPTTHGLQHSKASMEFSSFPLSSGECVTVLSGPWLPLPEVLHW